MMKLKNLLGDVALIVALGVALGACSKGGGGNIDAFMKLDTEKAAAFNAGGTDCVAKAKSVGDWRTKNTAKYKELQKKLNAEWPKGPPKDVEEKYGEQMKANKKAVIDTMMACSSDPAFSKMMDDTRTAETP
ncbi:MAG: hypothetical protein H0T89_28035 [Deltaproteobacteria bacterium]|nr:hypothetical protein [Deltaproteobacteria bacterium]